MVGEAAAECDAAAEHIQRAVIDEVRGDLAGAASAGLLKQGVVDEVGGARRAADIAVGDQVVCAAVGDRALPDDRRVAGIILEARQRCTAIKLGR